MTPHEEEIIESLVISVSRLEASVGQFEQNGIPGVRDFFASAALAVLASPTVNNRFNEDGVAVYAYKIADAMLKERDKKPNE